MAKIELKPWAPGYMVVETLTTRAAVPWRPDHMTWINVEREAREAIVIARLRAWATLQIQKGASNG